MNFTDVHFIRPYWFLASVPALWLFIRLVRQQQSAGVWSEVCDAALLPFILQQKNLKQSRVPLIAAILATLLSVIALAGPTWERLPSPVYQNESALVIALDLSLSMNAGDIKPSRLIRARYKIADILKQRKDGQTALIVYAGDAFTVTPLTNDTDTIDSQLSALTTDIMPSLGSNTALALQKATDLFKQAGLNTGQLLLVTDGAELDKTLPAIEHASNARYTVSILGVGTADGAPIKTEGGDFLKDANGAIVVPKLNIQDLAKLAAVGKGVFVSLRDDNQDIETLAAFFEQTVVNQNTASSELLLQQWDEKGPWLVLGILPLAAFFFRKGLLGLVLLLVLPLPKNSYALEWRDLWQTQDQQAQQAFKQKDFATAAERFKNLEWQAAAQYKAGNYEQAAEQLKTLSSAESFYNQGNALAQSGKLTEALAAYEQALKIKPNDADTQFNKALVEKALKEQQDKKKDEKDKQGSQDKKDQQDKKDPQEQKDQQKSDQNKQDAKDEKQDSSSGQDGEPQQDNQNKQQQEEKPDSSPDKPKDKSPEPDNAEQKSPPNTDEQKAEQANADQKQPEETPEEKAAAAQAQQKQDESLQANEQWLKRIPDDPAGLLKRKFKYQYGQQAHPAPLNADDW